MNNADFAHRVPARYGPGAVTDLPTEAASIPSRLGVTIRLDDGEIVAHLAPRPETCRHGVIRASVLVFQVDVVAGMAVDTDPAAWTFTSDLSLRAPLEPAPEGIDARASILRAGRRSLTSEVALATDAGPWAYSLAGFARVPRNPEDPEKPDIDVGEAVARWQEIPPLDEPLRDAAGIRAVDPGTGTVELDLRAELRNPAGALQGAMVALVAEAAAEDLADAHLEGPHVVTDLDIRFVSQARVGPVRSRAAFIGPPEDRSVRVELTDVGRARLITAVLARVRPLRGAGVPDR